MKYTIKTRSDIISVDAASFIKAFYYGIVLSPYNAYDLTDAVYYESPHGFCKVIKLCGTHYEQWTISLPHTSLDATYAPIGISHYKPIWPLIEQIKYTEVALTDIDRSLGFHALLDVL